MSRRFLIIAGVLAALGFSTFITSEAEAGRCGGRRRGRCFDQCGYGGHSGYGGGCGYQGGCGVQGGCGTSCGPNMAYSAPCNTGYQSAYAAPCGANGACGANAPCPNGVCTPNR